MKKTIYTGINVQWPISQLILEGKKTIETRTYPLPEKLLNVDLVMIETPGKLGKFKARNIAIIRFTDCIQYKDKEDFYLDLDRHQVSPDSPWAWSDKKPKWGWIVEVVRILSPPTECTRRGIVYRTQISI